MLYSARLDSERKQTACKRVNDFAEKPIHGVQYNKRSHTIQHY